MSVLIKGMMMPDNCLLCDLEDDAFSGDAICSQLLKCVTDYFDRRPDFCPIIEIPDHGDLIDRDELLKMDPWDWGCDPYEVGGVKQTIEEQPVVIPAERSKDD